MTDSTLINWTLDSINLNPSRCTPVKDMRHVIMQTKALPPLPGSAMRIIELTANPKASVEALVEIIELDPLLTAQIIRWASSSLYGYRGKITTVFDAITRVLGFNFVLDLALGLAVLAPLKSPRDGIIGTRMFWTQALASTRLMKRINERHSDILRFNANEVFLAALLHNIGFPLLGHQFSTEFALLNNLIKANPAMTVFELETSAFGISHTEIGAWLMRDWSMPSLLVEVIYHHHNPDYRGLNYRLNLLTYLNDCLLGRLGIGDGINQTCPDELWSELGLDAGKCLQIVDNLHDEMETISTTAEQLIN